MHAAAPLPQTGVARAASDRAATPGTGSTAIRSLVEGPRRSGRVLAAFPPAFYIDVRGVAEPRVVAVVTCDAVRLPVAIVLSTKSRHEPLCGMATGTAAVIGGGIIEVGEARFHVSRWWNPHVDPARVTRRGLDRALTTLRTLIEQAGNRPGLGEHPTLKRLARACGEGDLAGAVDAAERLVGLGPGLTPSGDDVLVGLLVALRVLGQGLTDARRAVMLADWLAAAVTSYADKRTTPLAGTLLHCAGRCQAAAEVTAVVRGLAARELLEPAARRLLAAGHTSGPDLACGLLVGGLAALRLTRPNPATP